MEKIFDKIPDKPIDDNFNELCDKEQFMPAKETVIDICKRFQDKDGNFIEQFQTTGFEQRLWEVMLYGIFESEGFEIKQDHDRPDFEIVKSEKTIFVEATTSNIQDGDKTSEDLISIIKSTKPEKERLDAFNNLKELYIEKIGSALYSKTKKNYQELEWVKGKPIVLAISPIHDDFARQISDSLLITYLFGYEFESTEDNQGNLVKVDYIEKNIFEKRNKSEFEPFFNSEDSKHISGVLFFNDLTVDKFNRMGFINGNTENITIARSCDIYDPESSKPKEVFYLLKEAEFDEDWKQGVSIFHNPNAICPLDENSFDGFRQVWFRDDKLDGHMPAFFPYTSITLSDTLE